MTALRNLVQLNSQGCLKEMNDTFLDVSSVGPMIAFVILATK